MSSPQDCAFPLPLAHCENSLLWRLISTNPGRASSMRKGFPTKASLPLSSSLPAANPARPSLSTFPAQTRHRIGRRIGAPSTRPRQTVRVAATASMMMSTGKEWASDAAPCVAEGIARETRLECSWTE